MAWRVIYCNTAFEDLEAIKRYLEQYSETAWLNLIDAFQKQTKRLEDFPMTGEKYKDYRRLVCEDYLIFYKVNEESRLVEVIRFLHGKRDIRRFL